MKKRKKIEEKEELLRTRLPKGNEVIGVVEISLGADKFRINCSDGKARICRIPGKFRKRIWISSGDVVLVQPWKLQSETRGDIIFRYTTTQVGWLKKTGYLRKLKV
jgi:translation initiation factor 1A